MRLTLRVSLQVPYFAEVYRRSGYDAVLGHGGEGPAYDGGGAEYTIGAPRAKLFRRDEAKVNDLDSLKTLLRYANYSDPYSKNASGFVDYGAAICMRGDLRDGDTGGTPRATSLSPHLPLSSHRAVVFLIRRSTAFLTLPPSFRCGRLL
jgi:hypothetical protein